jgi:hypothetical protein
MRSGSGTGLTQNKSRISSRFAAIHPTNSRVRLELALSAPPNWCGGTGRLMASLTPVCQTQAKMLRLFRLIATMDVSAPLPLPVDQAPTWDLASKLARSSGPNQLADRLDRMARPSG